MATKSGTFFEIDIEGLGEFRFLFSVNKEFKSKENQYYVESYWCPTNYGIVDFIEGHYVENIFKERIDIINNSMDYYIDGARISCICHIEDNTDTENVYSDILKSYFSNKQ
jgi:hypothetical protein